MTYWNPKKEGKKKQKKTEEKNRKTEKQKEKTKKQKKKQKKQKKTKKNKNKKNSDKTLNTIRSHKHYNTLPAKAAPLLSTVTAFFSRTPWPI